MSAAAHDAAPLAAVLLDLDGTLADTAGDLARAMDTLRVGLEWFLNPDHLPLIAGIELGWFAQAGLELELIAPDDITTACRPRSLARSRFPATSRCT